MTRLIIVHVMTWSDLNGSFNYFFPLSKRLKKSSETLLYIIFILYSIIGHILGFLVKFLTFF